MKELIINADDFGISSSANKGIIKTYHEGILTSASLMVGGLAFEEAVVMAMENPGLQVGLHLTLVQGRSVLSQREIPGLVDKEGNFTNNSVQAGMRYFFLKNLKAQLYREIEAQILKMKETGIPFSHIDGHLNIHMQPVIFNILLELMPKHGIKSFRLTRENLFCNLAIDSTRLVAKSLESFIFSLLSRQCKPKLSKRGIFYATEVKGLLNSGSMTEEYLLKALESIAEGVTELYFHPGYQPCTELTKWMPNYHHEAEQAALTSETVRKKIGELKITLRNYRGERKYYV